MSGKSLNRCNQIHLSLELIIMKFDFLLGLLSLPSSISQTLTMWMNPITFYHLYAVNSKHVNCDSTLENEEIEELFQNLQIFLPEIIQSEVNIPLPTPKPKSNPTKKTNTIASRNPFAFLSVE